VTAAKIYPAEGPDGFGESGFGSEDERLSLVHVRPPFGPEHALRADCWCHPQGEWFEGIPVWIHQVHH